MQCDRCHYMVDEPDPVCVPRCNGGVCDPNTGQCLACPHPHQNPAMNCDVRSFLCLSGFVAIRYNIIVLQACLPCWMGPTCDDAFCGRKYCFLPVVGRRGGQVAIYLTYSCLQLEFATPVNSTWSKWHMLCSRRRCTQQICAPLVQMRVCPTF
jgi:hypothetical protein